ncbi:Peroxisomal targeting signal 1 receptor [Sarcoptes scabiei]|nr:Peroxisomal targeting signal 1 receptor [Sarcoptes scabiei]
MSFQSLLESTECGTTNPIVDLALQLSAIDSENQTQTVGLNENLSAENATIDAVESLLEKAENKMPTFNMEALLEEMNRIESNIDQSKSKSSESSYRKFMKSDLDPFLGCSSILNSIEENLWIEATNHAQKLPELNVEWADEYLSKLECNNNDDLKFEPKNIWEIDEYNDLVQNSIRNHNVDIDSYFTNCSNPFVKSSNEINETLSETNLKDLVSDQETRLIDMLLTSNVSNEIDQENSTTNENRDEILRNETIQSESKVDENPISNSSLNTDERNDSFGENKFDNIGFWMKLAEEWNAKDIYAEKPTETITEKDSLGLESKSIKIREPIEELLEKDHPYHYRCIENNPYLQTDERSNYLERGIQSMENGDLSAAVLLFEAAATDNPKDANVWRLLGIANAKNENDLKSIMAFKRCLALNPSLDIESEVLMNLACAFTNQSMSTEACHALQDWLQKNPKYSPQLKVSIDEMNQYLGPEPLSQRWTDKTIFANGFFETVKQSFLKAANAHSEELDPDIQCALGILHNISGEYQKAIDCFRLALQLRPDDYCLWNRYGASLTNAGMAEESIFAYREALARYPGFIRARYNLAISCIMLGAGKEAVEHLLDVLNLQTSGVDSLRDLISVDRVVITSNSVWNLMRSALSLLQRPDLLKAIDNHDLELLNAEFKEKIDVRNDMASKLSFDAEDV